MGETTHFETELRMQDRDREFRWMLCRGMVIRDHMDLPDRIAGSLTDITEGKVADGLTGLPNRVLFSERVDRCVEQLYRRPGWAFSIIYMDMDDFKLINDNFGHEAGDQFLINVAKRLESVLRRSDAIIARLGGDEFAVLIEDTPSETNAIAIAERIDEQMRSPIQVGDREVLTRASMGIAVAPAAHSWPEDQPRLTGEMLLSRADIAMYRAKKQSEIPWCVFEPEMLAENTTRLELGGELKYAIERNELSVEYQPIVELQGGAPLGFEALLRWKHPVHGNVSPARFIPIAEGNGLIVEIGKWVLREACRQVAKWQSSNLGAVSVSVNVSVRQLVAEGFLEAMTNIVAEAGLSPSQLRLEVTESLLMQNPEATISL
jgi:diguanylate cyclase (GGDEF)-like protein